MPVMIRWCAIWLVIMSLFSARQADIGRTENLLRAEFRTQPLTATIGKASAWTLWIAPLDGQQFPQVEIVPADPYRWRFIQPVAFTLDAERLVEVQAVPLLAGENTPSVEIRFGNGMAPQIVAATNPVMIQDVQTQVDLLIEPAGEREDAGIYLLQINNRSPFPIYDLKFTPLGKGVTFKTQPDIHGIDAFASTPIVSILAHVSTPVDSPQLLIHYRWVDDFGIERLGKTTTEWQVTAKPAGWMEHWLMDLPADVRGILIGVVLALATVLITDLLRRWIEHFFQLQRDTQRTRALLEVAAHKAGHAAEQGIPFDMSSIETIFNDAGLFDRMQQLHAFEVVRPLWQSGDRHNAGISLPGGSKRAEDLKAAAQEVRKFLQPNL